MTMPRWSVALLALLVLAAPACANRKSEPTGSSQGASTSADAAPERGVIECMSIEAPAGSAKAAGVGGGLSFRGAKPLRSGTVSYDPSFTVTTQAAEGASLDAVRDELLASFTKDYSAVMRTASRTGGRSTASRRSTASAFRGARTA